MPSHLQLTACRAREKGRQSLLGRYQAPPRRGYSLFSVARPLRCFSASVRPSVLASFWVLRAFLGLESFCVSKDRRRFSHTYQWHPRAISHLTERRKSVFGACVKRRGIGKHSPKGAPVRIQYPDFRGFVSSMAFLFSLPTWGTFPPCRGFVSVFFCLYPYTITSPLLPPSVLLSESG